MSGCWELSKGQQLSEILTVDLMKLLDGGVPESIDRGISRVMACTDPGAVVECPCC